MKFGIKNSKLRMKAGVSLVTVLMFMLVATIAATATYKWITSEGSSSASRMMQREAYQSAVAGIENTRAWMTFHANDVGALIRQYIYENNQPKAVKMPINLDNRIRSFVQGGAQDHHVWLMGVNTQSVPYKVKILSEGVSRDGQARHTEVAIFNVSGLYQVNKPVVNVQSTDTLDFDYAYFGGSIVGTSSNYESAIINGDWNANPPTAEKNWVVTGNAELTGNSINLGGLTCIGGNLTAENTGITGLDLFVGGDAGVPKQSSFDLSGSAYFNGDVILGATGIARDNSYNMIIDSNVTLKGYMTSNNKGKYAKIKGNLCVDTAGAVVVSFADKEKSFVVEGNVWMPGKQNLAYGSVDKVMVRTGCTCDVIYPAYSTTVVQSGVACDGEEGTYWSSCPIGGYGNCKIKPISCASETVTRRKSYVENTDLAGSRSYDQIVMGKSGSEVYIKSARASSDYSSLSGKTYSETGKKRCPDNKRFRIYGDNSDNWERPGNSGHFTKRNPTEGPLVCGELASDTTYYLNNYDGGLNEWINYSKGWQDWTTASVSGIFPSGRPVNSDRYYLFDNTLTQTNFVTFGQKTYSTDEWRKYDVTSISGAKGDIGGGWFPIPMWSNDNNKFDNYFKSSVTAGLYTVGGQYFYDATNATYNYYNYEESRITGSPTCKSNGSEANRPLCGVNPWFKSSGNVHGKSGWPAKPSFDCADNVAEKCKKIWGNKLNSKKCGADYFVEDPIQIPLDELETFASAHSNACPAATGWNGSLVTALNACYSSIYNDEDKRKNLLYNKEYLVVKIPGAQTNISGTLVGKFVIIVDSKIQAQNSLITASDNGILGGSDPGSFVLLYLKGGATSLPENSTAIKHMFIFMNEGFDGKSHINLTGTLYFPAEKCIQSEFQGASFVSDSAMLADLSHNGIVCDKDRLCGAAAVNAAAAAAAGNAQAVFGQAGKDPYYISMAPQLGVTLESQYESNEDVPVVNAANGVSQLGQSFIVLPRIIYLTRDAYGKLSDYYSVIPLNGANVTKAATNVQCNPDLHVNSPLVDGDSLVEGLYNCSATHNGFDPVPFYVWVKGTQSSAPPISFLEQSANLTAGALHEVKISLPPHSSDIYVKVKVSSVPAGWSLQTKGDVEQESDIYTFHFGEFTAGHSDTTLFTLTPPGNATNGSVTFTLQPGQGYQLASPWTSTLLMASTATLTNNKNCVSPSDITKFCEKDENADVCPEGSMISAWPDCPIINSTTKEWVKPSWSPGYSTETKNSLWKVVTSGTGTLSLTEGDDAGECVVIIPEENNSRGAPILVNEDITLCATAKAKLRKIGIKFAGSIVGSPSVKVVAGGHVTDCDYVNKEKVCYVSVFDGDSVYISIDREVYKDFNYWTCDNNGGTTCPTTDPISSAKFSASEDENGFTVKDNNAIVYAHFGENDNHCFFDEFRKTAQHNDRHACSKPGETETAYCIGSGASAKWNFASGHISDTTYVERDPYQGYIVASKDAPKEGVKIISTVHAGIHGTLKALFQPPHATSSFGKDSPKIKNSGFLFRADDNGNSFWRLNVYENTSGHLAARVCLDAAGSCSAEVELAKDNYSKASVTTSSMVMLSATLKGNDSLKIKAIADNFYNSSGFVESDYYKAVFILSSIGNNHAIMNYQYVGFSLADRDFKIYGIGWQSDDYGSECFDGPPSVKCSFAAVAKDGVVPTYGTGLGQSSSYQKPWVGHSGWFDSKECSVSYSYVAGGANDATVSASDGYYFDESGAGAHGYHDNNGQDVKTAYATLANCKYAKTDVKAWESTVDPAHCGPFWTGKFNECQADVSLLANERSVIAGETYTPTFTPAKDLRGIKDLVITLSNDYADVDLEVWLISNSAAWGGEDHESRHVRITGSGSTITKHFSVAASTSAYEDFADNAAGFDPENIVAVSFRNNGSNPVTVKSAEALCKNAVRFDGCTVTRAGETEWQVTLNVSENADKLSKIRLKADVDGGSYLSDIERDYAGLEYGVADPGAFANAGKTYTFSAQVYSELNNYTSEWVACTCPGNDCSIGSITCGDAALQHNKMNASNEIEYGEGNPEYSFKLSGCPTKGCAYEVYLNGTKISECTNAQAASTGCSKSPHVVGPTQLAVSDNLYKYEVRNPVGSATEIKSLSACDQTFKVVEHVKDPVTCSITSGTTNASAADLGGSAEIPSNKLSVSCPEGTCTYVVKESGSTVGSGTYSDTYGFSISNGATEAGAHTYTATIKRDTEDAQDCSGSYTINYPLNLDCSSWTDPGASTPVAAGATITPITTKAGSSNTSYTGCGGHCKYNITKGGTSVYGSEVSNYDGYSATNTFTDANGSGKVTYTLTVSHPDVATTKSCNFDVTYETPASSSSGGGCHCTDYCTAGCGSIITAVNSDYYGANRCFFMTSANNLNLTQAGITVNGSSANIYCTSSGDCSSKLSSYAKQDGGWYVYVPNVWVHVEISGSNPCSGGGGGASSSSAAVSSSSAATPASSAGGGGSTPITVGYGSSNYGSFTPGVTYAVTINGGGGVFRCDVPSNTSNERVVGTFNGTEIKIPAWNTGSSTASNPGSGSTVTFVVNASAPSGLKCGTDW